MTLNRGVYFFLMDPIKVNTNIMLHNIYGLLTKCEVKMAGYWPSSCLRVYGLRWSQGP